ncbi:MAG: hypothetical protein LKG27_00530 [Clostridiaceae bacterium]|jgi:hypothetical protein|nr:hypothetical protein [Clostridiaceae bacterium]
MYDNGDIKYNFGKDYAKEFAENSKKSLDETKQKLNSLGITVPMVSQQKDDKKKDEPVKGMEVEHIEQSDVKNTDKKDETKDNENGYEDTGIKTKNDIFNTQSYLNDDYAALMAQLNDTKGLSKEEIQMQTQLGDVVDSMEDMGNENNKSVNFMQTDYRKGFHGSGELFTSYDKDNSTSVAAVSGDFAGSYRNKNGKFTAIFGGAFEKSKTKEVFPEEASSHEIGTDKEGSSEGTDTSTSQGNAGSDTILQDITETSHEYSYNASVQAKYDAKNYTFTGGATASSFPGENGHSKFYQFNAGAIHKKSGMAVTLKRYMYITKDTDGSTNVNNKTNLKLTLVENKEMQKTTGNITNDKVEDEAENVDENTPAQENTNVAGQEITSINNKKDDGTGFGLDLETESNSIDDQYGALAGYTFAPLKNKKFNPNKQEKIFITPLVGAYDVHPSSDEALKLTAGAIASYELKKKNGLEVDASMFAKYNQVIQTGSMPRHTFTTMGNIDVKMPKGKVFLNAQTGYVATRDINLFFANASGAYKASKHVMYAAGVGYTKSSSVGESNEGFNVNAKVSFDF